MKKNLLLWSVLILADLNVQGEVSTICDVNTYASLPAGRTASVDVGSYFKLSSGDLITPTLDLSHYDNITLTLDVATYGSSSNHPIVMLLFFSCFIGKLKTITMITSKAEVKAPLFVGISQDEDLISLNDFKGKKIILCFYPRSNASA